MRCLVVIALAAVCLGWRESRVAGAEPDAAAMIRNDWYFRESLAAIRDWETILQRWEKAKSPWSGVPVFPVPLSGQWVEWPNPVPLLLLPPEDRGLRVRLRASEGQVEIEHVRSGGQPARTRIAAGQTAVGYKHPGGGGKDHWYHAYHRRFDRLTTLAPTPAPLAVQISTPLDFQRGRQELAVSLSNAGPGSLQAEVQLQLDTPSGSHYGGRQTVHLEPGDCQFVRLPVELAEPGGGILILQLQAAGQSYWIPLLTHVEQASAVLHSIDQILADTPDPGAAAELAELRAIEAAWGRPQGSSAAGSWRGLFEQASRLRDKLLWSRIGFQTLLFVKRKPFISEQPFMDAHHLPNRPGGAVYRLSPVRPDGRASPVVDSLGEGIYRDLCLHWDGEKFLFAFGNGSDKWNQPQSYHIYEARIDGSKLRQLTFGPKNDCEPFYVPGGQIGFTSDRSEHFVMCGGDRHSPTLFVMEADGSAVRQLSFNCFNDFNPTVLPDGRILYSRWEYNERSVTSLHNPFTMNPDGTMVQPYYGNATIRPNVVMFPRPVPGSRKVMALFAAHHGQTHGSVGLIDVRRGIDGDRPLTVLTPEVPITGEKAEDSRAGWFSDPMPLSEDTWLCSYTPTVQPWVENSWALYVADRHGNLALIYRDPEISCAEPVPVVSRPVPHVRPAAQAAAGPSQGEATLVLTDVYQGLTGVRRGEAKSLRIIEDVPRKGVMTGGVICTSGTLIFTIKRVFGTVPIEPDGSAHFLVPADRNVYFEVLDQEHREIQRMRSVVCLRPGELRSCIGCHERRSMAPPARENRDRSNLFEEASGPLWPTGPVPLVALRRAPSRAQPPAWGTETVSFLRDVQPVLNARCVRCHAYDRNTNKVILTDDLTNQFTIGYEELLPYLAVAISNRWDHPDDVLPRPPYTYGSKVSPLTRLLESGHYGVELTREEWERLLTWIDCNGVYYDRYENSSYPNRQIFAGRFQEAAQKIAARRCAQCHGSDDGRHDTWWLSLNRRDVRQSRMLAAPLAQSAGGWGRCEGTVFATTSDPDYQALLALLADLANRLAKNPREDLLSIRGTEAETQPVLLPSPPPPPQPRPAGEGWVWLSDLSWESGRAGWTPNNDGLPRRDRDITDGPMRLGTRRFARGIGTHAPSEIVYVLEGKYARLQATVFPPERNSSVVFQVFGDQQPLFDSGILRHRQSKTLDIPLAGVRRLRLVVTDAGDGYTNDSANWAGARLQKANGT
ncbi:MAG: NPCBM/NEW2 domain-containing protein [Thermoguttaceae bacterium]